MENHDQSNIAKLTDEEWLSMIDSTRNGLPPCCANISNLRDRIIMLARNGGDMDAIRPNLFLQELEHVEMGHEISQLAALQKLVSQVRAYHARQLTNRT